MILGWWDDIIASLAVGGKLTCWFCVRKMRWEVPIPFIRLMRYEGVGEGPQTLTTT